MNSPLEKLITRIAAAEEGSKEVYGTDDKPKKETPTWDPRPVDKKIKLDKWSGLVDNVTMALQESVALSLTKIAQSIYGEVETQEEFDQKMSEQWESIFEQGLKRVLSTKETYGG